jgi:Protein of unknown function (DUF4238)
MSIPKNHHHVSQCHIRYFKNNETGKYYLYNKELGFFEKPKPSEESIFSEDYANTRFKDGELDHKGLEDELNTIFETDFVKHADKIIEAVSNSTYEIDSLKTSLQYLLRYAVISDMRHPSFKKDADDRVNDLMSKAFNHISYLETGEKSDLKISDFEKPKTKYSNLLDYNDIAEERLQSMGNLSIDVVVAGDNDEFILPDTGGYLKRARINNYINKDIKEIAVIGLPLTNKIFILARSVKLKGIKEGVFVVKNIPSLLVEDANRELYISGIKKVLARNKSVLEFIVEKHKNN